ncbi:MAG: hypothetical protein ACMG6S_03125 [Byssovorax sp.]
MTGRRFQDSLPLALMEMMMTHDHFCFRDELSLRFFAGEGE